METVSGESADVNSRDGMEFVSKSVLGESPNFVDLRLSPANAADKLKFVFALATRVEGLTDNSDWIASMHGYKEVTAGIVSESKAYSNYIKNSEFEITKVFERENISGTQLTENISGTGLTENIPVT